MVSECREGWYPLPMKAAGNCKMMAFFHCFSLFFCYHGNLITMTTNFNILGGKTLESALEQTLNCLSIIYRLFYILTKLQGKSVRNAK